MSKPKVAVVGYGVIGQRLADGVALQGHGARRRRRPSPHPLDPRSAERACRTGFSSPRRAAGGFDEGASRSRDLDELLGEVDIVLDPHRAAWPQEQGALQTPRSRRFPGRREERIVDVFFHGYANYERASASEYLKLTSCNTTGLIRAVDCLDREVGVERVIVTIIRRVADPGDTHRGLVDVAQWSPCQPPGRGPHDDHAAH